MNYAQKRQAFMLARRLKNNIESHGHVTVQVMDEVIASRGDKHISFAFEYVGDDARLIFNHAKKYLRRMIRRVGHGLSVVK